MPPSSVLFLQRAGRLQRPVARRCRFLAVPRFYHRQWYEVGAESPHHTTCEDIFDSLVHPG